eukprot:g2487.t1
MSSTSSDDEVSVSEASSVDDTRSDISETTSESSKRKLSGIQNDVNDADAGTDHQGQATVEKDGTELDEEERRAHEQADSARKAAAAARAAAMRAKEEEAKRSEERKRRAAQEAIERSWPALHVRIVCSRYYKSTTDAEPSSVTALLGIRRRLRLNVQFPLGLDVDLNVRSKAVAAWEKKFRLLRMNEFSNRTLGKNWSECAAATALELSKHFKCAVSWVTEHDRGNGPLLAEAEAAQSRTVSSSKQEGIAVESLGEGTLAQAHHALIGTHTLAAPRGGMTAYGGRGMLVCLLSRANGYRPPSLEINAIWLQTRDGLGLQLGVLCCDGHWMQHLDDPSVWRTVCEPRPFAGGRGLRKVSLSPPVRLLPGACASLHFMALGDNGLLGVSRDVPHVEDEFAYACDLHRESDPYAGARHRDPTEAKEGLSAINDDLAIMSVCLSDGHSPLNAFTWHERYSFVGLCEYSVIQDDDPAH